MQYERRSESELVELVMTGDQAAFQDLLLLQYDWLLTVVRQELRRRNLPGAGAEDLLHEICIKLLGLQRQPQINCQSELFAWMKTVVRNHIVDKLRQENRRKTVQVTTGSDSAEDQPILNLLEEMAVASDPRASMVARNRELQNAFWVALSSMSEEYRRVIELLYIEGCSLAEVAQRMQRSEDTIRGLRQRARQKLKDALIRLSHYV